MAGRKWFSARSGAGILFSGVRFRCGAPWRKFSAPGKPASINWVWSAFYAVLYQHLLLDGEKYFAGNAEPSSWWGRHWHRRRGFRYPCPARERKISWLSKPSSARAGIEERLQAQWRPLLSVVWKQLTGNPGDQLERPEHSDGPQCPEVDPGVRLLLLLRHCWIFRSQDCDVTIAREIRQHKKKGEGGGKRRRKRDISKCAYLCIDIRKYTRAIVE